MKNSLTAEEHQAMHRKLHQALDELLADWISETMKRPSQATVLELMQWSADQARNALPVDGDPQAELEPICPRCGFLNCRCGDTD